MSPSPRAAASSPAPVYPFPGTEPVEAAVARIRAEADARTARLLDVPPGAPLLVVQETVLDQHGDPLEHALLANRGDRWRYRTTQLAPEVEGVRAAAGEARR